MNLETIIALGFFRAQVNAGYRALKVACARKNNSGEGEWNMCCVS